MRRATVNVNILLVIVNVYVHAGAGAVGGKDRARNRLSATKRATQRQNRHKGDPYAFFILFHLVFVSFNSCLRGPLPGLVQDGFVLMSRATAITIARGDLRSGIVFPFQAHIREVNEQVS